jgi:hypothetical protein
MNSILRTSPFVASHTGGNEQIHVNARAGLLVLFKSVTVYNKKKTLASHQPQLLFYPKKKKNLSSFPGISSHMFHEREPSNWWANDYPHTQLN